MPVARKKTAGKPAGEGGVQTAVRNGGVKPPLDAASVPDRPKATGFPRHKPYGLGPAERLERLAMTGWSPAWVAARWGVPEAVLASWIAGTAKPPAGFLRWLWRMANVITAALPANHPPRLKPPPVRLRDLSAPP